MSRIDVSNGQTIVIYSPILEDLKRCITCGEEEFQIVDHRVVYYGFDDIRIRLRCICTRCQEQMIRRMKRENIRVIGSVDVSLPSGQSWYKLWV